jgi:(p)ppGpp synthase/HD superfamily hydrolase
MDTDKIINSDVLEFSTRAHAGQTRKFTGTPYITHPIAVASIAKDIVDSDWIDNSLLEKVALLHDVLEDTDVTYEELLEVFGGEVAGCVRILTKIPSETYLQAILRAKKNPITRIVKYADNVHNSSDLKPGCPKDKYEMSMYILSDGH